MWRRYRNARGARPGPEGYHGLGIVGNSTSTGRETVTERFVVLLAPGLVLLLMVVVVALRESRMLDWRGE